jgi:deoxyribonuclease-1
MKTFLLLTLTVLSFNAFGLVLDKLPNGDLAYYPKSFYTNLRAGRVTINELFSLLSESHSTQKGDYDQVGGCISNCYAHKSVGYDNARIIMFGERDLEQSGNQKYVTDVYCGKKFAFRDAQEASNMHTEVNIEHTWPQSKFSSKFERGMQKSDMHHLFLTDSKANSQRGNHEFGVAGNSHNELSVENCDISKLVHAEGGYVFEPPRSHRGNVARALFYFSVRYNMPISKAQEKALREWNAADPIDALELEKHDVVSKHQNIRNPFVDFPQLVNQITDF